MDTGLVVQNPLYSRPNSTNPSPTAQNTNDGVYSPISPVSPSTFIAPPPPPPLHGHSRQPSRTDSTGYLHPGNPNPYATRTHSRASSNSSWVPPPPPPVLIAPPSNDISHLPAIGPSQGALQLTLSYVGQPIVPNHHEPFNEHVNMYRFGHSSHSRNNSLNTPSFNVNLSPNSLDATQTHGGYNRPASQLNSYQSPILISSHQNNINGPVQHHHRLTPSLPHHSYTYPLQPHFSSNISPSPMLLSRVPSPFEQGPFPASSVPPQHLLTYRPTHTYSLSPSSSQSPPPPPRPPKPAELELEFADNSTNIPPTLPQRLQVTTSPNIYRSIPTPPEPNRLQVGAVESPGLDSQPGPVLSNGQHVGEEAVNASLADRGDRVIGYLSGQAYVQRVERGQSQNHRPLDIQSIGSLGAKTNDRSEIMGNADQAEHIKQGPTVVLERRRMAHTPESRSFGESDGQGTSAIRAIAADDAGYDGSNATNAAGVEDLDDVRSDSGMTMESYDPAAFDFPRRVNDEMSHIVSPTAQTLTSPTEGDVSQLDGSAVPIPATSVNAESSTGRLGHRGPTSGSTDLDGDAPPTYDQVELESRFIHIEPTTTTSQSDHSENITVIVSPTARYPAPSTPPPPVPLPPTSPPPAFRPQTPPRPGSSTISSQQQHRRNVSAGKRPINQPTPLPALGNTSVTRPRSPSDSSSGNAHDGLMMTPREGQKSSKHASQPSIFTSPPTPSPSHSPSKLKSLRLSLPRKFTTGSIDMDSLGSKSPASESGDPFMDPQTFQQDASPFAPSRSQNDSPISIPSEFRSRSPPLEHGQHADDAAPSRSSTWKGGGRSYSGFWSNISSTPPTPKSEILSQEALKQQAGDSSGSQYGASSSGGALAVVNVDNPKQRRPKSSSSRVSMFFRSPSSASPINAFASGTDKSSPVAVRSGGVDLLADGSGIGTWEQLPGQAGAGDDGGAQAENTEQSVLMDLWEGIEFGFRAPGWNTPPAPGPYSNPTEWPQSLALYPIGSKPFFIRAPTWRSLLRFLASQSTLRIEPSVEALAVSRDPTMDLRLVVQFTRTPYTPRGTTRDVCLYMMLHTAMPSLNTRVGRAMPVDDRVALEKWDTRALPYGFMCAEGGLLARPGAPSKMNYASGASELKGTPIAGQDPDGEDSMFVTIPPPFIELPVKMSDIALYLHECLVVSRKNGKLERSKPTGGLAPAKSSAKLRKGQGSSTNLPNEATTGEGTSATPAQDDDPIGNLFNQHTSLSTVPGIKRLAKAVKTFYPEEYAIGSSKANEAAEQAAVEDDRYGAKMLSVSNTGKGKSSSGKGGLLGAFQRARSKSSIAKQSVGGLTAAGTVRGGSGGRDTNAERFELVTPWRGE